MTHAKNRQGTSNTGDEEQTDGQPQTQPQTPQKEAEGQDTQV